MSACPFLQGVGHRMMRQMMSLHPQLMMTWGPTRRVPELTLRLWRGEGATPPFLAVQIVLHLASRDAAGHGFQLSFFVTLVESLPMACARQFITRQVHILQVYLQLYRQELQNLQNLQYAREISREDDL